MVEIAVCLFILSFVLIGASGLLMHAGRLAQHAGMSLQGQSLGSELATLVRRSLQNHAALAPGLDSATGLALTPVVAVSDCRSGTCGAQDSLHFELADWAARASAALPSLKAQLCRDSAPRDEDAGTWRWSCAFASDAPLLLKLGWRSPLDPASQPVLPQLIILLQ